MGGVGGAGGLLGAGYDHGGIGLTYVRSLATSHAE